MNLVRDSQGLAKAELHVTEVHRSGGSVPLLSVLRTEEVTAGSASTSPAGYPRFGPIRKPVCNAYSKSSTRRWLIQRAPNTTPDPRFPILPSRTREAGATAHSSVQARVINANPRQPSQTIPYQLDSITRQPRVVPNGIQAATAHVAELAPKQ